MIILNAHYYCPRIKNTRLINYFHSLYYAVVKLYVNNDCALHCVFIFHTAEFVPFKFVVALILTKYLFLVFYASIKVFDKNLYVLDGHHF